MDVHRNNSSAAAAARPRADGARATAARPSRGGGKAPAAPTATIHEGPKRLKQLLKLQDNSVIRLKYWALESNNCGFSTFRFIKKESTSVKRQKLVAAAILKFDENEKQANYEKIWLKEIHDGVNNPRFQQSSLQRPYGLFTVSSTF